jgi:hypothetical protein
LFDSVGIRARVGCVADVDGSSGRVTRFVRACDRALGTSVRGGGGGR